MQKTKLMLSVLAIVLVVGTGFAFKAITFTNNYVYTGTLGSGVCTFKVEGAAILCSGTPNIAVSTTAKSSGCPNGLTVEVAD